jgi:hypothetical protein
MHNNQRQFGEKTNAGKTNGQQPKPIWRKKIKQ